jgi:hypothetical protein
LYIAWCISWDGCTLEAHDPCAYSEALRDDWTHGPCEYSEALRDICPASEAHGPCATEALVPAHHHMGAQHRPVDHATERPSAMFAQQHQRLMAHANQRPVVPAHTWEARVPCVYSEFLQKNVYIQRPLH